MAMATDEVTRLAEDYATRPPEDTLALALSRFDSIAISFSGAEDVVLIDMAWRLHPTALRVFCLDTGRLHGETYQFVEKVRERYDIAIDVLSPDPITVQRLVRAKGLFSFYKDGHTECCAIRKVMPLKRHLATLDAWITGLRRDQNPTRAAVPVIQIDPAFATPEKPLIKLNPLANWSSADVWSYIHQHDVPYNELHTRGYASIGCEPCTRAVLPHQPERSGRWWWEDVTAKECGLHVKEKASR